ncbi:hypothetical protein ABMA28_000426 [Loxostege sticticalis]|uniref:Odorant receptor n=1 Tax=Loxostege sticticalis TaxID=481309 RepID=A0ABD0TS71_LOXSC
MKTVVDAPDSRDSPLGLEYIKLLSRFLVPPGTWPADAFGKKVFIGVKVHRYTLPYHTFMIVFGLFYYLLEHASEMNFLDIGENILTTFLGTVTAVRSILPTMKSYRILIRKFGREFHLEHYTHMGQIYEDMNKKINVISVYFTRFMMCQMILAMIMFNIAPMYNNITNRYIRHTENYTLEFSLLISYPGFKPLNYFATTTVYNFYLSYNCGVMLSGLDLILSLLIFQTIGHVKILRHNLENFQSPKNKVVIKLDEPHKYKFHGSCLYEVFDEEENEKIRIKLAECVEHHRQIINFTDELSELFGPFIAFNYLFHLVGCCLLLLECTGNDGGMLRFGPLTTVVFGQLIQISCMFELMGSEKS